MGVLIVIVIVIVVVCIFAKKSGEDGRSTGITTNTQVNNLEEAQFVETIRNSPMTHQLQSFLLGQFGDLNSEEIQKLRQLAAGGGRAGYIMEVRKDGLIFNLIKRNGESIDKWAISFDELGYQDLPYKGIEILKDVLLQTLNDIPHLMVLDTGFFMYQKDREKQSW